MCIHTKYLSCLVLFLMIAACSRGPTPKKGPLDHLNHVTLQESSCLVVWDAPDHHLSSQTQENISLCFQDISSWNGVYLNLWVPSSLSASGQGDLYAKSLQDHLMRVTHMSPSRITWEYKDVESSDKKGLVFDIRMQSYRVTPPDCGARRYVMGEASADPWVDLGCASSANLGAMVQDPRDLLRGRQMDAPMAQSLAISVNGLLSHGNNASSGSSGGSSESSGGLGGVSGSGVPLK